jgi:hypothetical protein
MSERYAVTSVYSFSSTQKSDYDSRTLRKEEPHQCLLGFNDVSAAFIGRPLRHRFINDFTYSLRNDFTGLACAARKDCALTIAKANANATTPVSGNTHHSISVRIG